MPAVTGAEQRLAAGKVRRAIARWEAARDLVAAGAWVRGADPAFDAAAEAMPVIEEFLRQEGTAAVPFEETRQGLLALASGIHA
jgi:flagellum-specific ATP synthase